MPVTTVSIPGLEPLVRGHVRELYDLDAQLLMVTTDRVAAYGRPLGLGLPDKGRVVSQLAAFWFDRLRNGTPSHYLTSELAQIAAVLESYGVKADPSLLQGRSMLVNRARPIPVKAIVRGYL